MELTPIGNLTGTVADDGALRPPQVLLPAYCLKDDEGSARELIERLPVIGSLLREAVEPLRLAFGQSNVIKLEALESDDDTVVRVIVSLPPNTEKPAEKMREFKRNWWLKNCSRSEASLVFDYEIGDGL